jgi:hypothetical protein
VLSWRLEWSGDKRRELDKFPEDKHTCEETIIEVSVEKACRRGLKGFREPPKLVFGLESTSSVFVLWGLGISDCCRLFRRILWTGRTCMRLL